jgi:hypothetical protein
MTNLSSPSFPYERPPGRWFAGNRAGAREGHKSGLNYLGGATFSPKHRIARTWGNQQQVKMDQPLRDHRVRIKIGSMRSLKDWLMKKSSECHFILAATDSSLSSHKGGRIDTGAIIH